jgi:ribonuclease R
VHEQPDPEKLDTLKSFLDSIGVDTRGLRHQAKPGDIRVLLERTRETPEFSVVSMLALRSMQKARYDALLARRMPVAHRYEIRKAR